MPFSSKPANWVQIHPQKDSSLEWEYGTGVTDTDSSFGLHTVKFEIKHKKLKFALCCD